MLLSRKAYAKKNSYQEQARLDYPLYDVAGMAWRRGDYQEIKGLNSVPYSVDGFILDSLKKEIEREKRQIALDWERCRVV